MATCGYICPKCNGTGFNADTLDNCEWCTKTEVEPTISNEDWIKSVHENDCCADKSES